MRYADRFKIVTWTLLFSFFLWNGNGWAVLEYSDPNKQLIPASQGLQPAKIVNPPSNNGGCQGGGGCNPVVVTPDENSGETVLTPAANSGETGGCQSQSGGGCDPIVVNPAVNPHPGSTDDSQNSNTNKPHSYTYVYVTNTSGGIDVQTYDNGVYLDTKPYSGAEVASAAKMFAPLFSRRFVAADLSSEFFLRNSFSNEVVSLLSKSLLLYDNKFSDSNSFSATLIRQLSSASFVQGTNANGPPNRDFTEADLSKPLSFDQDISAHGVKTDLSQVKTGPNNLSGMDARAVFNEGQLKDTVIQEAISGLFFFKQGVIQELLQKDAYQIKGDKVDLQSGEEPPIDSLTETNAKIDLMRSLQSEPNLVMTSFTALKGDISYLEESNSAEESLSMDNPPVVRSAADSFRTLIKKYPGLSIDDMNVKLLEGHLDLDRIDEGYTSPWSWMEIAEPPPVTSVLSVTG